MASTSKVTLSASDRSTIQQVASMSIDAGVLTQTTAELEKLVQPIVVPTSSPRAKFQNWGKSFVAIPAKVFAPTTVTHCAAIVELARRQGHQLRAIGRAHSPSDLPFTTGWAMRMEGLNGVVNINHPEHTITALAGTYISDIHDALDAAQPRLAMCNVGSISEQTIAGLISTATHGTGVRFPVVSSYVSQLTILCPLPEGTQHLTCSREQHSDLFNATLCGLGSTGLITSVTLRVQDAFNLKQYSEELTFDSIFGAKTGFPAVPSSSRTNPGASIGGLLSKSKRLPPCPDQYRPSYRSAHPSEIHPIQPNANRDVDQLARADPEDDEETRQAQLALEQVASSAQHVRLMWFPQVKRITMLRANRTTEAVSAPPSLKQRVKASLVGHRLTEFLLYTSRFNRQWSPLAVRWIHALTHPAFPATDDSASASRKIAATTEAPAAEPQAIVGLASDNKGTRDEQQQRLIQDIGQSFAHSGGVGASTEGEPSLSWLQSSIPAGDFNAFAKDSPAPQPLSPANPVWSEVGRSDRIFNMDCLFPQYTDEWAIPLNRAAAAIRAMRDWLDEEEAASDGDRIHFPIEIRFTDADSIWLSHSQGRKTCYIGIVQYRPYNRPVRYRQLFAKFEMLMRHYSGRPHWAKAHSCSPTELSQLYPHWNDFLATRQRYDPDEVFVNPYVGRHLLGRIGDGAETRVFKSRL
ncbi:D-arabinono-1,4-lactone oxidase [Kalmanozyma brasiliensis GHG001]|uniref:D-arabinono-1,4-lactone oxidase n=1 Tax=Kalmanozyma brasiliensis (strain GHG001) TaxID=1365824 RepID=V5F087_KALBG|nr:D-arabinono-1,4-lactone oxidase [Kalmanozyma brasiliensis GHG001]EST09688.1 D-arabinono-1,4-lactone oxidase [Kalmanozyma brasiliensis GHG001]